MSNVLNCRWRIRSSITPFSHHHHTFPTTSLFLVTTPTPVTKPFSLSKILCQYKIACLSNAGLHVWHTQSIRVLTRRFPVFQLSIPIRPSFAAGGSSSSRKKHHDALYCYTQPYKIGFEHNSQSRQSAQLRPVDRKGYAARRDILIVGEGGSGDMHFWASCPRKLRRPEVFTVV